MMHFKHFPISLVALLGLVSVVGGQTPSADEAPKVKVYVGREGLVNRIEGETRPASPLARAVVETDLGKGRDGTGAAVNAPSEAAQATVPASDVPLATVAGTEPTPAPSAEAASLAVAATETARPAAPVVVETPLEKELKRLQAIPPVPVPIRNLPLHVAIKLLANAAGMNYIGPNRDEFKDPVDARAIHNPWTVLQELQIRYHFEAEYQNGLWTFYRPREDELVMKTYQLRYNDLSTVNITPPTINTGLNNSGTYGGGMGGSMTGGVQTAQGDSGTSSQSVFDAKTDEIVKGVQSYLKIPVTGWKATVAEEGYVGKAGVLPPPPGYSVRVGKQVEGAVVNYVPSANRLLVVAPRQSMTYVDEYIRVVDRPLRQMSIRVLFVEMNRDKGAELGMTPTLTGNLKFSMDGTSSFPLNRPTWATPTGAILNTAELNLKLNALETRGAGRVMNQASVVALNNEKTQFASNLKIPIQSTSVSTPSASGAQTVQGVQYIDVGISSYLLPRVYDDTEPGKEEIRLNLAFTVSARAGAEDISGNKYPLVSERKFALPARVRNGETLVIGGLVESQLTVSDDKVPLLGDIPLIGWGFKSRGKTDNLRTLVAYITPILDPLPTEEIVVPAISPKDKVTP